MLLASGNQKACNPEPGLEAASTLTRASPDNLFAKTHVIKRTVCQNARDIKHSVKTHVIKRTVSKRTCQDAQAQNVLARAANLILS